MIEEKYLELQNGIIIKQNFPPGCKHSSSTGVLIPTRQIKCQNCAKSVDQKCDIDRPRTKQTNSIKLKIMKLQENNGIIMVIT